MDRRSLCVVARHVLCRPLMMNVPKRGYTPVRLTALAVALVALAGVIVSGQSSGVTGMVVDARTGRALSGVVVSVEGQPLSIETDAEGRFRLSLPPGKYVLAVSLVGYARLRHPLEVTASDSPPLMLLLSEGTGTYEEHVTVAGASLSDADAAPAGASLHGRELQALRGVTLDDPLRALHALPSASATDDFYSEFAVRGSPFRHLGFTVDGIPSRYLMHSVHGVTDGGSIAMINSDAVGSLALLPGSYPQRIGRHLGAQVDLTMRDGNRDGFRARGGLSGTSATALAEGPLGDHRGSWLLSFRRSYLDQLLKRIEGDSSLAFGFIDTEAKLVFDLTPRHQLQVLAVLGSSAFGEQPDDLGVNDEADADARAWLSGLAWRFTPSARFALTQRVFATGLSYENLNRRGDVLDDSVSTDAGWRADATLALRPTMRLEFGGDALRLSGSHTKRRALNDQSDLTVLNDYRASGHAASAYLQAVLQPSSRLTVTPGARVETWGPTAATTASPWLTAELAVTSSTRVHAGAGVYRQFADFEQIDGIQGGGANLRPETARHVDLGVSRTMPHDVTLQITGFAREERNVLWTPNAEPRRVADSAFRLGLGNAPWTNALDGHARGVEIVLRRDAPAGLSGWAGYAYGRHRYTDVTNGETFWADHDQRHALSLFGYYRISSRTTIGAKFRYGSNYPLIGYLGHASSPSNTPPLLGGARPGVYTLSGSRNTLRLPAYARLDIRADRTFSWSRRRLTLFGEVSNALNRTNLRNVPYGVDRAGRVFDPTDSLLPLVPSAGLAIEF
jgi:hypothetical protein